MKPEILGYFVIFRERLGKCLLCMMWIEGAKYVWNLVLFLVVLNVTYYCSIFQLKNTEVIYYCEVSDLTLESYCNNSLFLVWALKKKCSVYPKFGSVVLNRNGSDVRFTDFKMFWTRKKGLRYKPTTLHCLLTWRWEGGIL